MIGVVVCVPRRAGVADERGEIEVGDPPGGVPREVVVGQRDLVPRVREVGEPADRVEDVVGPGHEVRRGQLRVALDFLEIAGRVVVEVHALLGHRLAPGVVLLDAGNPADPVVGVGGDVIGHRADESGNLGQPAGGIVAVGELDVGREAGQVLRGRGQIAEQPVGVFVFGRAVADRSHLAEVVVGGGEGEVGRLVVEVVVPGFARLP